MELGTLGSILKYALNLEYTFIDISKDILDNCKDQEISSLFQDLIAKHEKFTKKLKRIRRENTTEMILEPIENFNSDNYVLREYSFDNYLKENIQQAMIKIEKVIRDFYVDASEKVSFLTEVSTFLENLAKKHEENLKLF